MFPLSLLLGKELVVFNQRINRANTEHSGELRVLGLRLVMVDDVVGDLLQPFGRVHQLLGINSLHLDVYIISRPVFLLIPADILHREPQHILILDGICDGVGV